MLNGWVTARLAARAPLVGANPDWPALGPPTLSHMARTEWRAAAHAFREIGWEHDRRLMLSLLDDPAALDEAASIAEHSRP
jgi:hypothetical protein